MPIKIPGLVLACALAATAPQGAQAFRLGALITRARAPRPLQKPDARKAWLDAAVVGPLPALANPPWLDAALRLAKRDAEAFVPELHATLTDTVHASPGATLKDVSAAVSQRAAQWAETRAPFARWTAAHYLKHGGISVEAPQLGEALEPLYEEYQTGRLARRKPLKALAIFLRAGVIRAAAAVSKVSAARPRRPRGRTPLVCNSAQIMNAIDAHWLIAQVRKARRSLLPGLLDDVAAALPPTPAPPAGLGDACRRLAENTFVGYAADGLPVAGSLDLAAVASNLCL